MDEKKRRVISYKNCSEEVLNAINEQYPLGYGDSTIKIEKPNGEVFYAITVETADVIYLVKIDVKIDTAEELDKALEADLADDQEGENTFGGEDGEQSMGGSEEPADFDE